MFITGILSSRLPRAVHVRAYSVVPPHEEPEGNERTSRCPGDPSHHGRADPRVARAVRRHDPRERLRDPPRGTAAGRRGARRHHHDADRARRRRPPGRGGAPVEDRGEPRRGLRQHRRRGVHRGGRAGDEHARRPDRDHRGHRVRPADGGESPRGRGRALPAVGAPVDLGAADDAGSGHPPQDDRDRGVRPNRPGRGAPRERVRDAGHLQRRDAAAGRRGGRDRRGARRAGGTAARGRLRVDPHEPTPTRPVICSTPGRSR